MWVRSSVSVVLTLTEVSSLTNSEFSEPGERSVRTSRFGG